MCTDFELFVVFGLGSFFGAFCLLGFARIIYRGRPNAESIDRFVSCLIDEQAPVWEQSLGKDHTQSVVDGIEWFQKWYFSRTGRSS